MCASSKKNHRHYNRCTNWLTHTHTFHIYFTYTNTNVSRPHMYVLHTVAIVVFFILKFQISNYPWNHNCHNAKKSETCVCVCVCVHTCNNVILNWKKLLLSHIYLYSTLDSKRLYRLYFVLTLSALQGNLIAFTKKKRRVISSFFNRHFS